MAALLGMLTDSNEQVRRKVASALATLPINREAIGYYIDELLQRYEPITSKLLEAEENVDALLFALQQIVEGV